MVIRARQSLEREVFHISFPLLWLCLSKASFSASLRPVVQRWCRRNREGGALDVLRGKTNPSITPPAAPGHLNAWEGAGNRHRAHNGVLLLAVNSLPSALGRGSACSWVSYRLKAEGSRAREGRTAVGETCLRWAVCEQHPGGWLFGVGTSSGLT